MDILLANDAQDAVSQISQKLVAVAQQSDNKKVHISLSGGSTPKLWFKYLVANSKNLPINYKNLHFWWGDDRAVEHSDAESNFGEACRLLFDHIDIPQENLHPIFTGLEINQEAKRFATEMKDEIQQDENGTPIFDWIILGMGDDGHTASLFPNQTDFTDKNLTVVATHPQTKQQRISKTAHLINNAKEISFLVTGANKAKIISEIYHATNPQDLVYPAAKISSNKGLTNWYLDKDACKLI